MRSNQGFVLLTVLLFLQIFSLLGLYACLNTAGMMRRIEQEWQREKDVIKLEQILARVEEKVALEQPVCLIALLATAELAKKPLSWWQHHGCRGDFHPVSYYYVVELMGKDPCAQVGADPMIADYARISLSMFAPSTRILWQSTIVIPVSAPVVCRGKLHRVTPGHQMRLEI